MLTAMFRSDLEGDERQYRELGLPEPMDWVMGKR